MNLDTYSQTILFFIAAAVGTPLFAAVAERLSLASGQRKEYSKSIKSIVTATSWICVSFVILTRFGFETAVLIKALGLILGILTFILVAYGFGKDIVVGLMLISDNDLQTGIRVEIKNSVNVRGEIREIGIVRTKVIDDDGKLHILPNRTFQTAVFLIASAHASTC